jgi:dTMP kinase
MGGAGVIVVLDGIDGCGKTTLVASLARALEAGGWAVKVLRDPGGTETGEQIRALVKDARVPMDAHTQMLLFSAARCELARQVITPWLLGQGLGRVVVLDRWWFSTFAYQTTQGVSGTLIRDVAEGTARIPLDSALCFWLDVPPREAQARRSRAVSDAGAHDRFDRRGLEFATRVRGGYERLHRERLLARIDADHPPEAVFADVWAKVQAEGLRYGPPPPRTES